MAGTSLRLRWWLVHRDGTWRIKEMENFDMGTRLSLLLAAGLQPVILGGPAVDGNIRTVRDAAEAIMIRLNYDEAGRLLDRIRAAGLPRACRFLSHDASFGPLSPWAQRRCPGVVRLAQGCQPDMPGCDLVRVSIYNNMFRGEPALKHARLAEQWLSDHAYICHEIGLALQNLGRMPEAAVYFRKALDDQPTLHVSFLSLLRCLGPNIRNDDIGERFLKIKDPQFEEYAQDRWKARDHSTLLILAKAMGRLDPRNAEAKSYLALAEAEERRLDQALAASRRPESASFRSCAVITIIPNLPGRRRWRKPGPNLPRIARSATRLPVRSARRSRISA